MTSYKSRLKSHKTTIKIQLNLVSESILAVEAADLAVFSIPALAVKAASKNNSEF